MFYRQYVAKWKCPCADPDIFSRGVSAMEIYVVGGVFKALLWYKCYYVNLRNLNFSRPPPLYPRMLSNYNTPLNIPFDNTMFLFNVYRFYKPLVINIMNSINLVRLCKFSIGYFIFSRKNNDI